MLTGWLGVKHQLTYFGVQGECIILGKQQMLALLSLREGSFNINNEDLNEWFFTRNGGNAFFSATASLPTVTVDEETGKAEADFKQQNKLQLSCSPISTTLAIFDE